MQSRTIDATRIHKSFSIGSPFILVLLTVLWTSDAIPAKSLRQDPPPDQMQELPYRKGELLVKFKASSSQQLRQSFHAQLRASEIRSLPEIAIDHIKLPPGVTVDEALATYRSNANVEFAEPNYFRKADALPNDPQLGQQWGLYNFGQTVTGIPSLAGADIHALSAWDITTGSPNVLIAVIDSGIAWDHPDLAGNIWTNTGETPGDGIDNDGNGYVDDVRGWDFVVNDNDPMDVNGHGTIVAGTIAALGNNGIGTTGVLWTARVMALKGMDAMGFITVADEIAAINYAIAKGADVINASFGATACSQSEHSAIAAAASAGILFVTSAGNSASNIDLIPKFPTSYSQTVSCGGTTLPALTSIIGVAAVDQSDNLASFSNYGTLSVHVAAPGVNIYSTKPSSSLTTVLSENMESAGTLPPGWTSSGTNNTWALTTATFVSTNHSLTDSPAGNYVNNTDSFSRSPGVSTVGQRGCRWTVWARYDLEEGFDFIDADYSLDGASWNNLGWLTGSSSGAFAFIGPLDLPDGKPTVYVRTRLTTDNTGTADGIYLDDLMMQCTAGPPSTSDLLFTSGTSLAAPYVTGIAGLLLAQDPFMTLAQIKEAIVSGVDPKGGLTGKVSSGGRVNAARALGAQPGSGLSLPGLGGSGSGGGGGGCFIATAVYGSPLAPEVQMLRRFRDSYLLTNRVGRFVVWIYYRLSPPLAEAVKQHAGLRVTARALLWPILGFVAMALASPLITMSLVVVIIAAIIGLALFTTHAGMRRGSLWLSVLALLCVAALVSTSLAQDNETSPEEDGLARITFPSPRLYVVVIDPDKKSQRIYTTGDILVDPANPRNSVTIRHIGRDGVTVQRMGMRQEETLALAQSRPLFPGVLPRVVSVTELRYRFITVEQIQDREPRLISLVHGSAILEKQVLKAVGSSPAADTSALREKQAAIVSAIARIQSKEIAPNTYEVTGASLEPALENLVALVQGSAFIAQIGIGNLASASVGSGITSEGVKISNSAYTQSFGIRPGDTITTVNGYPVNSLSNIWWTVQELLIRNPNLTEVRMEIVRRGARMAKTYRLR
jgi:subtilisin family serine protease